MKVSVVIPCFNERNTIEQIVYAVRAAPIKDIDLETENGILVWSVDLDTPGPGHEEVMIDATTGAVLRQHHEEDIVSKTIPVTADFPCTHFAVGRLARRLTRAVGPRAKPRWHRH